MSTFSIYSLFMALCLSLLVSSAPVPADSAVAASGYWLSSITRQGTVAFGGSGFQVFRNVKDFGAKGDGMYQENLSL
jgi:glucan 1,3-beta-glucosidase